MARKREESVKSAYEDRGEWVRGKKLGEGGFGEVHVAKFPRPRAFYFKDFPGIAAVKSTEARKSEELVLEKEMFDRLGHSPFIIECLGEDVTVTDEGHMTMNVFLEFAAGGTLWDLLRKSKWVGLLESQVRRFTWSILGGLVRIHEKGFVHCDIKLKNVLLVRDQSGGPHAYVAKVADLGLAKSADKIFESCLAGTHTYWAPETVKDEIQGQASDVWALGCVVLGMLTGKLPWAGHGELTNDDLKRLIATESPTLPCGIYSEEAEAFLYKCFRTDPHERPSAADLLREPFVCNPSIHN